MGGRDAEGAELGADRTPSASRPERTSKVPSRRVIHMPHLLLESEANRCSNQQNLIILFYETNDH